MGPLAGIRVIELKGLGPGPYAGMLLADLGADVVVVERSATPTGIAIPSSKDVTSRGKRSIVLDIKKPEGLTALLRMVEHADVLFEGFRPGVAERLGIGPEACHERNPALIYGRLTGWGQNGPLSRTAGHDINYISLNGVLAAMGTPEKPVPPLNVIGDYAGGSLFLVVGIIAAMLEAKQSGKGQVVDASVVDGSANLMSFFHGLQHLGQWSAERRGSNLFDGGASFYDAYETSDGKFVSVAPLEPQFYAEFVERLGLGMDEFGEQSGPGQWPEVRTRLEGIFKTKSRDEWCEIFEGSDACVAPVLDFAEAPEHPHNVARDTYIEVGGVVQPAPAPKFSRSVSDTPDAPRAEGADSVDVLRDFDFDADEIDALRASGALS